MAQDTPSVSAAGEPPSHPAGQIARRREGGPPRRLRTCLVVCLLLGLVLASASAGLYYLSGGDPASLPNHPFMQSQLPFLISPTPSPLPTTPAPTFTFPPSPTPARIGAANARNMAPVRHIGRGSLLQVAFSPDGEEFFAVTKLGLYTYRTNDLSVEPAANLGPMAYFYRRWHREARCAAVAPDGSTFAIGSDYMLVTLWRRFEEGKPAWEMFPENAAEREHGGYDITALALSPNGELAAAGGSDNVVRIWSVPADPAEESVLIGGLTLAYRSKDEMITSVAFSPDGTLLAAGSSRGRIHLWRVQDGALALASPGHSQPVNSLAFSPDGSRLASGSWDGAVRLWSVRDGSAVWEWSTDRGGISSVAFSPDGRRLAAGSFDRSAYLLDAESGSPAAVFQGYTQAVMQVAFSPDGRTLATASADTTIRFWDTVDGTVTGELTGFLADILGLDLSPDDSLLAAGLGTGEIPLFQMPDGSPAGILRGAEGAVNSVAFAPDGERLAAGSADFTVRIWELGNPAPEKTLLGHRRSVVSVAYSPDGRWLASGSRDGTVRLWNAADGALALDLTGGGGEIRVVEFSPNGELLAAGGEDSAIYFWNVADGSLAFQHALPDLVWGVDSLAFSPDGSTVIIGAFTQIFLNRVADGGRVWSVEDNSTQPRYVGFLDGGKVVFCGDPMNGHVWFYRALDGSPLNPNMLFSGGPLSAMTASHSGLFLVGGMDFGLIEIYAPR